MKNSTNGKFENEKSPKREKSKIAYNRISAVMAQKGMCQQELADLINTNPSHAGRIINGKRPCVSLPLALKIAKALETPVESLFFLEEK